MNNYFTNKDWRETHIRPRVREVLEQLAAKTHHPKIRYIVLFGSVAKGTVTLTSDVDIALVSDEPLTIDEKHQFNNHFANEHYPAYRVINTLTSNLDTNHYMNVNYHIKKDGLVIYER